jgi:hypothetical protein
MSPLMGGAAVYRCDTCFVLNSALGAEADALSPRTLLPQARKRWEACVGIPGEWHSRCDTHSGGTIHATPPAKTPGTRCPID